METHIPVRKGSFTTTGSINQHSEEKFLPSKKSIHSDTKETVMKETAHVFGQSARHMSHKQCQMLRTIEIRNMLGPRAAKRNTTVYSKDYLKIQHAEAVHISRTSSRRRSSNKATTKTPSKKGLRT